MTSILVRGGVVIDTEPIPAVLGSMDVLVVDGRIAAVGAQPEVPPGTEVIDAAGRLVLPGFVDTHLHTWQAAIRSTVIDSTLMPGYVERVIQGFAPRYRAEDVYTGVLAGALESLDSGITTLVDWSHIQHTPEHTDANVAALKAAGIRAVFGYAYGRGGDPEGLFAEGHRVRDEHFNSSDGLVTMTTAAFGPEFGDEDHALREWRLARDLDLPVTTHMGGHSVERADQGLAFLERNGLMSHPTTYVHANYYTDEAFKRIADSGGTVSVSPISETVLAIGYPVTGRSRAAGIPTALSGDSVACGPVDMFTQMRTAYMFERVRPDGAGLGFTAADVLHMATLEGARVAGLGNVTGSLRPGKQADIVLLRTDLLAMTPTPDPIAAAALYADPKVVDTVLVGGRIVKRDGRLLHHDIEQLRADVTKSAEHLTTG